MHPILAFLNGALTLLVIAMLALGGLFYFAKLQYDNPGPLTHATVVVIPRGEGVNGIATRLEQNNVISDRRIFVAAAMYFRAQQKLKAGEYEIRKGASMRQVLDTITQGRSILHKVTMPEGMTSYQLVERLNAHPMLQGQLAQIPREGSLLPDTYKFTRGMSRSELIERMQAEQTKFVDRLWENRATDLPVKTKQEAIILASIVEKETGRADERGRVAGVFVNRLKKKIRLQSDPTIIYGLVGGKGTLGRPILRSELQKVTAYNTYHINGLPPTPIANPGRAAIEAVLNPESTKDIFFVADGTGGHIFAETLAQHNKNVRNWRKIEKEMRAKRAAQVAAAAAEQAAIAGKSVDPAAALLDQQLAAQPAPQPAAQPQVVTAAPQQAAPQFSALQGITITQTTAATPAPVVPAPPAAQKVPQIAPVSAIPGAKAVPIPIRKPLTQ